MDKKEAQQKVIDAAKNWYRKEVDCDRRLGIAVLMLLDAEKKEEDKYLDRSK